MNRELLLSKLRVYKTDYFEEEQFIIPFTHLLQHPEAYQRNHFPGHITGSAWIIDQTHKMVLLTHHAKLNRWLQPGGHADGNENIIDVALTEAREETGLENFELIHESIFDIDIHTIPARRDIPEHLHYDVRILLKANASDKIILSTESHELAWVPIHNLATITGDNRSIMRMAEKVQRLFA